MPNLSKTTKDRSVIRRWAEERGATPSHVKSTGAAGDVGILRFDFPGYSGEESLEPIAWEEFFAKFDERGLALVYEEETAQGQRSNFNKLISAGSGKKASHSRGARAKKAGSSVARRGTRTAAKKSTAKKAAGSRNRPGAAARKGAKTAARTATKKAAGKKTASKRSSASSGRKKVATKKRSARRR